MELLKALEEGTSIVTFFTESLPGLFQTRAEEFSDFSEVPIIICTRFDDARIFCVAISANDIEIEDDEMVDFPNLTILSKVKEWNVFLTYARRYILAYDAKKDELKSVFYFTKAFALALEKFDLHLIVEIVEGEDSLLTSELILNNYEVDVSFPRIKIKIDLKTLDAIAAGDLTPIEAAKIIEISGDVLKAAELGHMFLKYRP